MLKSAVSIVTALCFFLATSGMAAQNSQTPDISKLTPDVDVMVNLGLVYSSEGEFHNDQLAATWFRRAAEAGNVRGMYYYGVLLRQGWGVKWDEQEAMSWFRKAAELGDRDAQSSLGIGYKQGLGGGTQDYKQAAYWFTKAIQQRSLFSEWQLAILYENGWGVPRDTETAKFLLTQVIQDNHPSLVSESTTRLELEDKDDRERGRAEAKKRLEKIESDEREVAIVGGLVLGGLLLLLSSDSSKSDSQPSSANSSSDSVNRRIQDPTEQNRLDREKSRREYERQQQQDFWRKQKEQYNRNLDCRQSSMNDRYGQRCP